ncbi:uncharacterized protein METZ01_LOCUS151830, partial [marine metagenome]
MIATKLKVLTIIGLLIATNAFSQVVDENMPFGDKALEIYTTAVELRTAKGHKQVPVLAEYLASE